MIEYKSITLKKIDDNDFNYIRTIYNSCEDFLLLNNSEEKLDDIIVADINYSIQSKGEYCLIMSKEHGIVGIIDYISKYYNDEKYTAYINLLMINEKCRYQGIGSLVLEALEGYLYNNFQINSIHVSVQINNGDAILFWTNSGFVTYEAQNYRRTVRQFFI